MVRLLSRSLPIYQYLLIAFFALGLPIGALVAYSLYERQQQQSLATINALTSFSDIIAVNTFRMVEESRELLQRLAERPAIQELDKRRCDTILPGLKDIFPRFVNLATLDVDGNLICSAITQSDDYPVSMAKLDVFLETKKTNKFAIGFPHKGPLSGKLVLTMAQPINTVDHRFIGLIGASLDLNNYQLLPVNLKLPEGVSVVALADNGIIVARSQNSVEQLGQPFSDPSSLQVLDQHIRSGRDLTQSAGGTIVSSKVGDTGWRIVVTQDDKTLGQAQWLPIFLQSLFVLIIGSMGIYLIYFLIRLISLPLRHMAAAADMIAEGDFNVRLKVEGPKELALVATQFNQALDVRDSAKSALRESEERFRSLVEWSPDCIAVHRNGKIVYVNPATVRLLGAQSATDLVGTSILSRIHPDFHQIVLDRIKMATEKGALPTPLAEKFLKLDGTVIDVEVQSSVINYEGEAAFYVNIRDIGQQKQSLIALSESEYRWKFAIEGAGDGLWDWDVPTGKVFFSKRLKEMFGFTEDEFSDELSDWERRIHPEDVAKTWESMRAHLDGVISSYESEHRVRCKNGSWKWILDRGLVVSRNADGIALRMIGTHADITERVLKNQVLNETFNKISNLQLAIDEHAIVAITNAQGIITHANEKFCRISQYTRAELVGRDHSMINSGHHPKAFMRELWRTIARGQVWKGEIMNRAKDGSFYWVDTTLVPFLNDDGKILQYFAIRRDITEQKNMMLAMRQSADQLRALAAYQSRVKEDERKRIAREIHDDLGGTLTGIQSYLSVLIGRTQRQATPVDQILLDVSAMTEHAIDTVRKLITELRPSVLDQLGIWAALESHATQISQRNKLTCVCVIEPGLEDFELDADASTAAFRIAQELITNIIRHAGASRIHIRATRDVGWIKIEVEDDGKGIQLNQLATGKSWGIIGMHERAQQCHGDLSIVQASQGGTLAVLRLPLGQADE